MENLVKCVVGFLAIFFAKIQMLKWTNYVNQGGGGYMEWKVENGEWRVVGFSTLFH
ncbi:MAG: hypothetical protein LBI18_04855 [Planctomycetaceae bacterium]|jgi:hypothetical protein|nr:hypothetical protein [Planctomycetaceae bacterium]